MSSVLIAGGGLAGLASAAALSSKGHRVTLLESRPFLGGRAASYEIGSGEDAEVIDNCQHILLRCCVNLLDFYRRLGVADHIAFSREFTFIEPGGRQSALRSGIFPAPAHFAGSFLRLRFLNFSEKLAVARAIQAIGREYKRPDLETITMQEWLEEKRQPKRAIDRFWRQVLVSAINEELDRMAAAHGFQVFRLGFLARKDAYEMGVPAVPLGKLYSAEALAREGKVAIRFRTPVTRIVVENGEVRAALAAGEEFRADCYICALPFERIAAVAPDLPLDAGSTGPLRICRTRRCSTAQFSGCSTSTRAATFSSSSVHHAA
jgi:squalene-associated FAD-dependent desaturase